MTLGYLGFRVSQTQGYLLGCPSDKDYSILGSILGPPILGNYHVRLSQMIEV